jgi:hypothetical protein
VAGELARQRANALLRRAALDARGASHLRSALSHGSGFDGHSSEDMRGSNVTERDRDWLAERFDEQRSHLRGVAYRMLGR